MSRIIAITGASSGIGLALARHLAQPGNHLILLARRTAVLQDLALEVTAAGARATVETIDFQERGAWQKSFRSLCEDGFKIDTFYHCAIRISAGAAHHTEPEDWQAIYRVNLLSTSAILATVYPAMLASGGGRIILFSSLTSLSGGPMSSPYGATKTAIYGTWKSLQPETLRSNVTIHLVSPSFVDTPLFGNFILRGVTSQQMRQSMLATRLPIMSPDQAAQKIVARVAKGKRYIIFPFRIALTAFLVRRFPSIGRAYVRQSNRAFGIE